MTQAWRASQRDPEAQADRDERAVVRFKFLQAAIQLVELPLSGAPIRLKGRVRPHARYLEAEARQKRIADLIAQEQTVMDAPPHQLFACVGCGHVESAAGSLTRRRSFRQLSA